MGMHWRERGVESDGMGWDGDRVVAGSVHRKDLMRRGDKSKFSMRKGKDKSSPSSFFAFLSYLAKSVDKARNFFCRSICGNGEIFSPILWAET